MRLGKVQASGYVADVADEDSVVSEIPAEVTEAVAAAPEALAADRERASVSG